MKLKTVKVKPKSAVGKAVQKVKSLMSRFYTQLRNTPLQLGNCRKQDFSAQVIEKGKLPRNIALVHVTGQFGHTFSLISVNNKGQADLGNGHLFNLNGLKKQETIPAHSIARYARKNGKLHTIEHGPKKVKRTGYIIGNLDDMYVGWVSKDNPMFADTLETKALPGGRNKDRCFSLVK